MKPIKITFAASTELAIANASRWTEATATAVKSGQFVEWSASKGTTKGRVVSVHNKGNVPGVIAATTATPDAPAARVQLWAKRGDGWEATGTYIAYGVSGLSSIEALPEPTVQATESVDTPGSFDDLRSRVQQAIRELIGSLTGTSDVSLYVCDIGTSWAVYDVNYDGDLWLIEYTVEGDGTISFGTPIEVTKRTLYEPVLAEALSDHIESRLLGAAGAAADGGRIFDVEIIRYGDSKNGRRYPEAVMRKAAPLYEGAKAFDHHRTDAELASSTVQGLVGHYRNVEATTTGLKGQLHLLPSALHVAEALDSTLANQAAGLPPLVGISHDVQTQARRVGNITECVAVLKVNSSDVVADPAAGGAVTRMVAGGSVTTDPNPPTPKGTSMLTFKQLLALLRTTESANRAALLTEHASVLTNAGYTGDEALRMAEAAEAPAATERVTEAATFNKTSLLSAPIIDAAIAQTTLDAKRFREGIVAELADHFTEAELVATVARQVRAVEAAGLSPQVPHVEVTQDSRDKQLAALDAMLDPRTAGGYRSLKEAFADINNVHGRDTFSADFTRQIMQECAGVQYDSDRATESITSGTFGTILGDSITRRMIAEYSQPNLQVWRQLVSSIVAVNDFRTQRIEAMGGYGTLPAVLQGAPYNPLTSPGNEEATYAITKRGGTEDLTIETIANDDIRALQRIPVKLGLAAAQTLYRFVLDIFNANPTLTRDATALFAAGHNNVTTTALSSTALEVTRAKLRKQSAYGDTADILSLIPKFLLVTPENEALAFELCTSAFAMPSGAPVGAATNTPNLHQGMVPLVVDYWSATSTTEWFVLCDPAMAPTIEVGFYNGQEDPALFVQNDPTAGSMFTTDKLTYKIRHIYSGAPIDYRGFQRGNT